ncbi:hypothetical protein [Actinoplanes regularis]|uniref:Uncharacterized protein n=1 Tax=Actinoplanes regularis TaxID=52697 RepID=A0A239BJZ4_9ACTN|nr:hypothetical protein [Actinoplanes regularis]SNS07344.1 hypothetical protein SAMN06264365_109223 [Actinoplanes regularis]
MAEFHDADDALEHLLLSAEKGQSEQIIDQLIEEGLARDVLRRLAASAGGLLLFQSMRVGTSYAEVVRMTVDEVRKTPLSSGG